MASDNTFGIFNFIIIHTYPSSYGVRNKKKCEKQLKGTNTRDYFPIDSDLYSLFSLKSS